MINVAAGRLHIRCPQRFRGGVTVRSRPILPRPVALITCLRHLCRLLRLLRSLRHLPWFVRTGMAAGSPLSRWISHCLVSLLRNCGWGLVKRGLDSQASPAALTSPSLCLNLDTLSSDGSVGPGDVSSHPICISDVSTQSGDRDQELSGDDAPPSVHVDLVTPTSPPAPARVQQFMRNFSPATAPVTLMVESSTQISPNRVRSDCTPGTVDVFQVSQDTTGFILGRVIPPCRPCHWGSPAPSETASACPPRLGERVALDISRPVSASDAPAMSGPVIPLPSRMMLMPVSCSAQTVLAPGFPSQPCRWSSAIPQTRDVNREGPFDAYCSPMDTGDYPLVNTGLPGCP